MLYVHIGASSICIGGTELYKSRRTFGVNFERF
ncbi:hypothetical protein NECAME_18500 [Necator americanus]|uniref:Uncharacterized protein n=1 Tax=Necator americanus TaxID=51031 RepID=W2SU27_NECAM|nr:hypothetical protein NECAME_18500 [Necator americanus]ETN73145.1 hypothetical protein NECAME_18500 [Necator americanus]